MKQIICKCGWGAGWGGAIQYMDLLGGGGEIAGFSSTDDNRVPFAVAGKLSNFTLYSGATRSASVTATVMVNGVATAITATLLTTDTIVYNESTTLDVNAGDDISIRISGPNTGPPGYEVGISIQFEGAQSVYGVEAFSGSISAGNANFGGIFGNGQPMNYFAGLTDSNTYSICPIPGNVTTLALRTYSGAPGTGVWTGYIRKNGILQDGTGGTVDTSTVLTGTDTIVTKSFTLPAAVQDHFDVVIFRTVTGASFANNHVAAGIGFTATTPNQFVFCGGSNDAFDSTQTQWKWTRSEQEAIPEYKNLAPVGLLGLVVTSFYVERSGLGFGDGRGYLHTLRKSGANTDLAVTILGFVLSGSASGLVSYKRGDTVDIQIELINTPGGAQLHWSFGAYIPNTGKIIVAKVTNSGFIDQEFTIRTIGLSLPVFTLKDGESQEFTELPAGQGYAVSEDVINGWRSEIVVSNNSPAANITIGDGEEVTVLIVNTRSTSYGGLYYIHPGKTNDSLWTLIEG